MNKLIGLVCLGLMLGSTVFAQGATFKPYASVSGGFAHLNDANLEFRGTKIGEFEFDGGSVIEGAIGVSCDEGHGALPVRAEVAVMYQENELDKAVFDMVGVTLPGGEADVTILSYMINGYLDLIADSSVTPYVLIGFGAAEVEIFDTFDDDVVAGQVGAGVSISITENLVLDFEYKFLMTEEFELDLAPGLLEEPVKIGMSAHQAQAGIRLQF